jgi:hypothetical protein
MNRFAMMACTSYLIGLAFSSAHAGAVMRDTTLHGVHIELHVMAAEPFYSKKEVASNTIAEGMMVMGGARPVGLTAASHPDHHLVVHVFDAKTGTAITDAKVKIKFHSLSDASNTFTNVPIVVMQAIGKGAPSTHYGNNVTMPNGSYVIAVIADKIKVNFTVTLSDAAAPSMGGMDMH